MTVILTETTKRIGFLNGRVKRPELRCNVDENGQNVKLCESWNGIALLLCDRRTAKIPSSSVLGNIPWPAPSTTLPGARFQPTSG